ncbi:hypothetical protein VTN02DRAFT_5940 [Thermoascus thermophilus]
MTMIPNPALGEVHGLAWERKTLPPASLFSPRLRIYRHHGLPQYWVAAGTGTESMIWTVCRDGCGDGGAPPLIDYERTCRAPQRPPKGPRALPSRRSSLDMQHLVTSMSGPHARDPKPSSADGAERGSRAGDSHLSLFPFPLLLSHLSSCPLLQELAPFETFFLRSSSSKG